MVAWEERQAHGTEFVNNIEKKQLQDGATELENCENLTLLFNICRRIFEILKVYLILKL